MSCAFRHGVRCFTLQQAPGMMGLCVRRDDGNTDVAPDIARLPDSGGDRPCRAVAVARHRAGFRQDPAAAVFLFQSRRCRQPDRGLVRQRHHLETSGDHVVGIDPGVRDRLAGRGRRRLLVRAPAARRRGVRSLCQNGQRAAAGGAGADLHAVARSRHLVQGRARRHAGVLHRVLQCLSGRQGSLAHRAGQRPHARHERAAIDAPCLLAVGAVVDVFLAAHVGRLSRWSAPWSANIWDRRPGSAI